MLQVVFMLELVLGAVHLVAVAEASIAIPNADCRGGLVDVHAAEVQLPTLGPLESPTSSLIDSVCIL
ncbi:hypothetical protein GBAR_LOCUS22630, partial [Geodia barretti]